VAESLAASQRAAVLTAFDACATSGSAYLLVGQPARTFSGGSAAPRACTALAARGAGRTLYVCDEPTTGCIRTTWSGC